MDDPFSALNEAMKSVFHLLPMRNGKYAYPEIQQLKEAIENYQDDDRHTFVGLVKAIGAALPHFEKWRINFEPIKNSVDVLAAQHKMPAVNWDRYLTHPKISPGFQFKEEQDPDFILWLKTISKETFAHPDPSLRSMLIAHREHLGFSQKLNSHLKDNPNFLSNLIMESKKNFIEISSTRLIFYLTDEQIAKAIIQFLPDLIQENSDPFAQAEQLVEKLNGILSNGRSISTLLRNSEARDILNRSEFFQIYQSEEYRDWQERPSFTEVEALKPQI
ncbi:hypothetical protein OQJ15_10980 [Fluoribacter dumoffii]|uniref:hypothetical protein n=1 Tax=Fluoribacter dumoffii TaxID=463 RepID=UPI002244D78D|nr:hypothetical protein [Fluoribacter dumoffii]MCW8386830.1 hypothetical protein [Fluoribacter dumoffii]MCW8497033.1 hypothetical protein [Fluoribacter dumoffii]